MRRREFITLLSCAAAWASPARAQEPRRLIGLLGSTSSDAFPGAKAAFIKGLKDTGFIEGNNISIEWRWAEGQYNRLPSLAGELVSRDVAVIVAFDAPASFAAKAATKTIPIVFLTGADPVKTGLVDSFNRPGGNLTGLLSLNMLVTASAPIVAPLIGGQVLLWFDWRAIFWVLVGFGLISLLAAFALPETLGSSRRNEAHPLTMVLGYFEFFRSVRYVGYVACSTLYFCCLFAFIAGSPFVYIEYFGVPPQYYGFLFGVNMLGMIASTFINSRIVVQYGGDRLLRIACAIGAAGGLILLATGVGGAGGIIGLALPLFMVLSLLTVVASNAISGALSVFPNRAGAAAALAGALQFGAGALTSAAVGWFADGTPRPMSVIICAGAVAALAANSLLIDRRRG